MRLSEVHPRVPKEMAVVIMRLPSVIFQWSWETEIWQVSVVPLFKKGEKEVPGNYKPITVTVSGKSIGKVILGVI